MFTKFPDGLWPFLRSPSEIAVMLRILKLCGFDGKGECFEEASTFAGHCGISPRTLTDVLRSLEDKGLIVVKRKKKQLNRILLSEKIREISNSGKICRHKENNTNIYMAEKFAANESEIQRIHSRWLKKQDSGD